MVEVMPCAKKVPTSGATAGRILAPEQRIRNSRSSVAEGLAFSARVAQVEGQAGNGPKPFAFQRDNELILRLILGATLRNLPSSDVKDDESLGAEIRAKTFARVRTV